MLWMPRYVSNASKTSRAKRGLCTLRGGLAGYACVETCVSLQGAYCWYASALVLAALCKIA